MSLKHIASILVFSSAALLMAEEPATPKTDNTPPKTESAPAADTTAKTKGNLIETLTTAGRYKTLLGLIEFAGMSDDLRAVGQLTIFAPTDEALAKANNLEAYKGNRGEVRAILNNHLVGGAFTVPQLLKTRTLSTRNGLIWSIDPNGLKIHDANIVQADLEATNGVVQGIDTVLLVARESTRETTEDVTLKKVERKVERDAKNTGDTIYGGLKDGTDKTYDGLKSGTNKVKKFFTGD